MGKSWWSRITHSHLVLSIARWFDDSVAPSELEALRDKGVDWIRIVPFISLHLACFAVIWVGWSWTAVGVAIGLYILRMLAITGAYHRYFSHRTYKTSRSWQFIVATIGSMAVQGGPLWWAAHHRHHHKYADEPDDLHSPAQHGFWWSHIGWFTTPASFPTRMEFVREWARFPELRFLNRFSILPPFVLLGALIGIGELLRVHAPALGTNALQLGVWGFAISTVAVFHATATINSLAHVIGRRRYNTRDTSRNNWLLAIITLGEGWHNNHHRFAASARQGFFWWEYDLTYYVLVLLLWLGIIRDLRAVPAAVLNEARTPSGSGGQGSPRRA